MATKCSFNVNDVANDLWDTMKANKKGDIDNARAITQAAIAGRILKAKADQLHSKKLTNKPASIEFYNE